MGSILQSHICGIDPIFVFGTLFFYRFFFSLGYLFIFVMEESALSLVILNGYVYPVKKEDVSDLVENYAD